MKVARFIALGALLAGCTFNTNAVINADTDVNATANTLVNAPINVEPAAAASSEPEPPAEAPSSSPSSYKDYRFTFQYPAGLTARDLTLSEFAQSTGSPEFKDAAGKAALIATTDSPYAIYVVEYDPASLEGSAEVEGATYAAFDVNGAAGKRGIVTAFRDGKEVHVAQTLVERADVSYAVVVIGYGMDLDALLDVEQLVLTTWAWK